MAEFIPEFNNEAHLEEGIPEDVFKAWYGWNLRLPQNQFGLQVGVLSKILQNHDIENVLSKGFSHAQLERLINTARSAHAAKYIPAEVLKDEEQAKLVTERVWNAFVIVSRSLITALLSKEEVKIFDPRNAPDHVGEITQQEREKLSRIFEMSEAVLRSEPLSKILKEYRDFFDQKKREEQQDSVRTLPEIFDDLLDDFAEGLRNYNAQLEPPLSSELIDKMITVARLHFLSFEEGEETTIML